MAWVAFWLGLFGFASLALIVWRAEKVVGVVLAQRASDLALKAEVVKPPAQKPPLPPDLELIAQDETEPWAREQVRAAIQDLYEVRGDWDAVRNAYLGAP